MSNIDAQLDHLVKVNIAVDEIAEPADVMLQLAVMAERIRVQHEMIDALKKPTFESVCYLDLERQDDAEYDRECR
jgi:hypothetical protein